MTSGSEKIELNEIENIWKNETELSVKRRQRQYTYGKTTNIVK